MSDWRDALLRPALLRTGRASLPASGSSKPSRSGGVTPYDRLDMVDLRDPAGPDRLLNQIDRRIADRLPIREPVPQASGRRRPGCGRSWTARARSGSARRSGGRAARSSGCRRRGVAGHGSRGPASESACARCLLDRSGRRALRRHAIRNAQTNAVSAWRRSSGSARWAVGRPRCRRPRSPHRRRSDSRPRPQRWREAEPDRRRRSSPCG